MKDLWSRDRVFPCTNNHIAEWYWSLNSYNTELLMQLSPWRGIDMLTLKLS
jgi:hypothetical protein